MRTIRRLVVSLVVVFAVVGAVFFLGMRTKSPLVLNAVRRSSRAMKPLVLKTAGSPGAPASVIRHTGRVSGRQYVTPVQAAVTDDGFVIALPYGSNTDWLKNVLASGSATILHDGGEHLVGEPEIVPTADVQRHFSPSDQRAHRWFAVDQTLRLRRM
jgi:deazaflavin-dependent oxidoreductase (nitroreductase family)